MWLFANDTEHRQIIYHLEAYKKMSWFVLVLSLGDDCRWRNGHWNPLVQWASLLRPFSGKPPATKGRIDSPVALRVPPCNSLVEKGLNSGESHTRPWPHAMLRPLTATSRPFLASVPKFRSPLTFLRWRVWPTMPLLLVISLRPFWTKKGDRKISWSKRERGRKKRECEVAVGH